MILADSDLNRARSRLVEMHYRARAGHLGGNLSCIDAMMVIYHEFMTPEDRFILSKGHSAGALYVTLWTLDRLTDADLASFHQDNTLLGGHPPPKGIADVLFATGSLGHGLSLAAGLAKAAKLQGQTRRVFALTSDGEWQEGSTLEAIIFAIHQRLDNLTILVDHNGLQGFGSTEAVASMNPLGERLAGFGIETRVCDGHDPSSIREALSQKQNGPLLIVLNTVKGRGIPKVEGLMESHYLPLSADQYSGALATFATAS
ncbi:1-deoxy-D-xylulose-5-phosphate synthase N-terminal domain-containing protein [Rhodopseudomonas sp. RCAM05734]|uniref:1-deoxy-D-xylulose-5-phosphate synthase N-terminal domain-containing protein n=1 Tax=Rhodopseudomonas sp. RCAM05734 TaxID=3457549 RepID=UPI004044AE8F